MQILVGGRRRRCAASRSRSSCSTTDTKVAAYARRCRVTVVDRGLDVGGTKARGAGRGARRRASSSTPSVPAEDWSADRSPTAPPGRRLGWSACCRAAATKLVAVGVGAQGLRHPRALPPSSPPRSATGVPGDGASTTPRSSFPPPGSSTGIGVIAGTGAIAVGRTPPATRSFAGGWGWVHRRRGGGRRRSCARRPSPRCPRTTTAAGRRPVGACCARSASTRRERLARAVNDDPTTENWGPRRRAVFAAADAGRRCAVAVIGAADHLAGLVDQLVRRGARRRRRRRRAAA